MTGLNNESLVFGKLFKIFFDKAVLQPVLAGLTCFAVGNKFIGVKRNLEIKVVVNHDLKSLAFNAFALVFIDGFAVNPSLGTIAIGIDSAAGFEFFHEFGSKRFMEFLGNIAQCVAQRKLSLCGSEAETSVRCAAIALFHFRILRKSVVKFDCHCFCNKFVFHTDIPSFVRIEFFTVFSVFLI